MAACLSARRAACSPRSLPRRVERLAVAAAGGGGGGSGRAAAPPRRGARQQQLLTALAEQAAREAWGGWLGDLVLPLMSSADGAKAPPPPSVPRRELADADSSFVIVDGVELHYKEALPAPDAVATGSSSSSGNGATAAAAAAGNSVAGSAAASAQRPTVLLVHGLNGSTFNWRHTLTPLADATGCRVIAFDRPPFGLAERPLSWGQPGQALSYNPYTLDGAARLTAGLLDALGVSGPVFAAGHSLGAVVCMELAQRMPGRIAGLGFIAPALPTTPDRSWQRRATLGTQLRFLLARGLLSDDTLGLRLVRRQILRRRDELLEGDLRLHSEEFDLPQDVVDGYLRPLRAPHWDRGSLLHTRALGALPQYDYAALEAPVLLVTGSEDGGLTANARELSGLLQARRQGTTRFVELEGVGHVPMDEVPAQLNELLIDFVNGLPST